MQISVHSIRQIIALTSLLSFILIGCSDPPEEEQGDHEGHSGEHSDEHGAAEGRVHLDPGAMEVAGIKTAIASASTGNATIELPGVVKVVGDGMARVGSVTSGRIVRLHSGEGSYVRKGAPVATIESAEVGNVRAEYLEATAKLRRAEAELHRQEVLSREEIGAGRNLQDAQAAVDAAQAAKNEAAAHLRLFGVNPARAGGSSSNRISVNAPISGIVSSRPVTLGEYVEPSDDLFILVNTATVWVDAQATAAQVSRIAVGGVGFVEGPNGERTSGRIIYISPTLDPESRTATVRVAVENPGGRLRPGSFVTLACETERKQDVTTVPSTALDRDGERLYLWKPHGEGEFERVEIEGGEEVGDQIIVTAGIEEGERVVSAGVFYLRSALKGSELSEHHH